MSATCSGRRCAPPLTWRGSVVCVAAGVVLLVAAGTARGEDLLRAKGETLAAFDVEAQLSAVDHATALGLAESFARVQRDEQAVSRQFARRFREAHLELLRDFYEPGLVEKQRTAYDAARDPVHDYASEVVAVEEDPLPHALIRRTWRNAEGLFVERKLRLLLEKRGEFWWVKGVEHEEEGKGWVPAGLGTPPAAPPISIPAAARADRSSPEAALRSLDLAARRLGAQRERAHRALYRHFDKIVGAFYGPEAEAKAAKLRPKAEAVAERTLEVGAAEKRLAGLVRIEVTAYEAVPDEPGARSAVGQTALDFRRGENGEWQVVGELVRWKPESPLEPRSEGLALFLLLPAGR